MSTAQELFKSLMKDHIASKLREIGFKGSGQNYSFPSEEYWALLSFQKSMFSDSNEIRFTMNLLVMSKKEWDKFRSERSNFPTKPNPTTQWGVGWTRRIGFLIPQKQDFWWSLYGNSDLANLSNEIIGSVINYALPAIKEQLQSA